MKKSLNAWSVDSALGFEENRKYCETCRLGKLYSLDPELAAKLRSGMYGAVVSRKRLDGMIRNVSNSANYLLDPAGAFGYGGLQDYRAKTGETRPALILSERSPAMAATVVAEALGISREALRSRLEKR